MGLVAFGLVMVYSATSASAALANGDPAYYLKRQAMYAVLGLVLMVVCSRIDYRALRALAPVLMVASVVLLLAVLVLGRAANGASRWISFGPLIFQPSELAKLALAIWAAGYLARHRPPRTPGRALAADRPRHDRLLWPDPGRARPRHRDRDRRDARGDAARRRNARPHARARPRDRRHARPVRSVARALPSRAPVQLPQPVAGRAGRGLPDRAGDDRPRLRRDLRRGPRPERPEGELPARGAHGHDLRDHRRGARPRRRDRRDRRLLRLRLPRPEDRAAVQGPVRQAARGRADRARLRPGGDQPRGRDGARAADRDPAAVRLLRRLEPRGRARLRRHPP